MISAFIIGISFGVLLQAGQFCFVSGFRNIIYQKNPRFFTALMIAITIQSIGFYSLQHLGILQIPEGNLPVIATVLGGFLFGGGMVLAGCCGSGAWFRSGEGLVGTWLALLTFIITLAAAQKGSLKQWLEPLFIEPTRMDTIYDTFNISPWVLIVVLASITALLLFYQHYCFSISTNIPATFRQQRVNLSVFHLMLSLS